MRSKLTRKKLDHANAGTGYCRVHGTPAYVGYVGPQIGGMYFYAEQCRIKSKAGNFYTRQHGTKERAVVNGSCDDLYFRKLSSAQRFVDEIHAGLHPRIVLETIDFHRELDVLDAIILNWPLDSGYDDEAMFNSEEDRYALA